MQRLPLALRAVAALFIIGGFVCLLEDFVLLSRNHIRIDFGLLQIPVGFGLLRLHRGWRTCALVLFRVGFVLLPIITVVFLVHPGPSYLTVLGTPITTVGRGWGLLSALVVGACMIWEYRVLTSPVVCALFGVRPASGAGQAA